jgi:glycosyltransferase involved in cell wall biosynthesis
MMTTHLAYLLHSGQMFGTERMALATLLALRALSAPANDTGPSRSTAPLSATLIAPPGPVHAAAAALGLPSRVAAGRLAMLAALGRHLLRHRHSALLATGVWQSLAGRLLQVLLHGRGAHLHLVHGGTDERLSYGRKRLIARLGLRFVAVSAFVQQRLLAHGVPAERIAVVGNFLPSSPVRVRPAYTHDGVRRVVMLCRLDRIKRVGLLFDALDATPGLAALRFDIYGTGEETAALRERARKHPSVQLHGFRHDAASALAGADLLLHTCPEEPFGLALLEAFAAGVVVLAPNSGGTGEIVQHGSNGWHFSANDPVALGQRLWALMYLPAPRLNALADGGRLALRHAHDPTRQARRYAELVGLPFRPTLAAADPLADRRATAPLP